MFTKGLGLCNRQEPIWGYVNYTDPGLSHEHFEFAARQRVRARDRGGIVRAGVYVSKCSGERFGSVFKYSSKNSFAKGEKELANIITN